MRTVLVAIILKPNLKSLVLRNLLSLLRLLFESFSSLLRKRGKSSWMKFSTKLLISLCTNVILTSSFVFWYFCLFVVQC